MDPVDARPASLLRGRLLQGVLVLLALGLVVLGSALQRGWGPLGFDPQLDNPFADRPPFADPDSAIARVADGEGDPQRAEAFRRLAEVPQGTWLTPEDEPAGEVGQRVARLVGLAAEAERTPVLVVYGIPDRDCAAGESAGGLGPDTYLAWVREIAEAAAAYRHTVVVLEPDAVVSAPDCPSREQRMGLLRDAAGLLADAGVTTYLDGGHSAWRSPEEMVALLREAGVEQVRGFATNVSNYQPDEVERSYGEAISERLDGAHFVIDRGRNGAGGGDAWCNRPGWRLGAEPEVVGEGPLDAFLWIKPPAESDGACNGGPPAGEVWPDRVLEAVRAAGW